MENILVQTFQTLDLYAKRITYDDKAEAIKKKNYDLRFLPPSNFHENFLVSICFKWGLEGGSCEIETRRVRVSKQVPSALQTHSTLLSDCRFTSNWEYVLSFLWNLLMFWNCLHEKLTDRGIYIHIYTFWQWLSVELMRNFPHIVQPSKNRFFFSECLIKIMLIRFSEFLKYLVGGSERLVSQLKI